MVARLEIYAPNAPGKNAAIIDEFVSGSGNVAELSEIGGITNNGFNGGSQDVTKEAKQARVYGVNGVGDRSVGALVAYYRHLQCQGDAGLALPAQEGLIYCRDYAFQIHDLETNLYQRVATVDSTTEVIGAETFRCGFTFPCWLIFGAQLKVLLGAYGEQFEFGILERVDALPDEITTQPERTIRVAYGAEFTVDFLSLSNPYIRQPIRSPGVNYSIEGGPEILGPALADQKQEWVIEGAELTLRQLKDLRSLLSRRRNEDGIITLTDLTTEISEATPATRAVATGSIETVNGQDRYFASFNVSQDGPVTVTPKNGDSSKVLVSVTFREV